MKTEKSTVDGFISTFNGNLDSLAEHLAYRQYFVVVFGELESIVRVLIDTTFLYYRVLKPFERRD